MPEVATSPCVPAAAAAAADCTNRPQNPLKLRFLSHFNTLSQRQRLRTQARIATCAQRMADGRWWAMAGGWWIVGVGRWGLVEMLVRIKFIKIPDKFCACNNITTHNMAPCTRSENYFITDGMLQQRIQMPSTAIEYITMRPPCCRHCRRHSQTNLRWSLAWIH